MGYERGKRKPKDVGAAAATAARTQSLIAAEQIEPRGAKLDEFARARFDEIIATREPETWLPYDVFLATLLARFLRRLEEISEELDKDGYSFLDLRGRSVANPMLQALNSVTLTVQGLSRMLGLSASQRGVSGAAQGARDEAAAAAKAAISRAAASDDLI
jgi:phage terminase small subunit